MRAAVKRSIILIMRLRERLAETCLVFPAMATGWVVLRIGDEIFSNVKAGMVHPLFIELKHGVEFSWNMIN